MQIINHIPGKLVGWGIFAVRTPNDGVFEVKTEGKYFYTEAKLDEIKMLQLANLVYPGYDVMKVEECVVENKYQTWVTV